MSPKMSTKSRRKFQHQQTNIDELSALLEQPSAVTPRSPNRKKNAKNAYERKGESRSKSAGRVKSPRSSVIGSQRFQNTKSKSAPILPSPTADGEFISLTQSQLPGSKDDFSLDKITLKIGSLTYEMDFLGRWSTSTKNFSLKEEAAELHLSNRKLFEENNLLRVKNELLLDMITKKGLRKTQIEAELKRLRKIVSSSSNRFTSP